MLQNQISLGALCPVPRRRRRSPWPPPASRPPRAASGKARWPSRGWALTRVSPLAPFLSPVPFWSLPDSGASPCETLGISAAWGVVCADPRPASPGSRRRGGRGPAIRSVELSRSGQRRRRKAVAFRPGRRTGRHAAAMTVRNHPALGREEPCAPGLACRRQRLLQGRCSALSGAGRASRRYWRSDVFLGEILMLGKQAQGKAAAILFRRWLGSERIFPGS